MQDIYPMGIVHEVFLFWLVDFVNKIFEKFERPLNILYQIIAGREFSIE